MLKFMRNKVVGVERTGEDLLRAYGVLDDDIYGLELDVSMGIPDMVIRSIDGRFKRWTTPECPKAIPVLQQAVGFCVLEEGFSQRIQKSIGRKGCRHFANLLLECCETARQAAGLIQGGGEKMISPEVETSRERTRKEAETGSKKGSGRSAQAHGDGREGMVIDLHVHTYPASPCSVARVEDVIAEAKRIGLDGICLTDHNYVWDKAMVDELRRKHDFLILRGSEITTDQGDVLVFGLERAVKGIIKLGGLRALVSKAKGVMIAAHPFRGFLLFGTGQLGMTPDQAMARPLFRQVDGIEVLNSKVTAKENHLASEVAKSAGIPGTGGSDAHQLSEIGVYATRFEARIEHERDLVKALRSGRHSACAFRDSASV